MTTIVKATKVVYNAPYKNVNIKLKFNDIREFLSKFKEVGSFNDILNLLLVNEQGLYSVTNKLAAELENLDLYSVEVIDRATGSGLEIILSEYTPKPTGRPKKEVDTVTTKPKLEIVK